MPCLLMNWPSLRTSFASGTTPHGIGKSIRISLRTGVSPKLRKRFVPTSGRDDCRICLDWEDSSAFLESLRSLAGCGAKARPRKVRSLERRSVTFFSQLRGAPQRDLRRPDRPTLPRARFTRRRSYRVVLDRHTRGIQSLSFLIVPFLL